MAESATINARDVELLNTWFKEQSASLPEDVRTVMARVLRILAVLETLIGRHKKLLASFKQAMGITPKSESGAVLTKQ